MLDVPYDGYLGHPGHPDALSNVDFAADEHPDPDAGAYIYPYPDSDGYLTGGTYADRDDGAVEGEGFT